MALVQQARELEERLDALEGEIRDGDQGEAARQADAVRELTRELALLRRDVAELRGRIEGRPRGVSGPRALLVLGTLWGAGLLCQLNGASLWLTAVLSLATGLVMFHLVRDGD